ncbi:MAG: peptidyl-prolyl cis-trans isomerase [Candidatus Aminicenantes bacterium]|nr:peptidyl-prolyl cis-trans isomerase [Candidatus Aminicenantes bacterium]
MSIKLLFGIMSVVFLLAFPLSNTAADKNPKVIMKTSMGDITLELYMDKAPVTVKNFLGYVDDKFYDGTIFHRVIKGFMIQGGGHTADMNKKPTKGAIKNEADNGLSNKKGTIAMARMPDPHSATAQFFINHGDNPNLDHSAENYGYCVFGKVIAGMDVVDAIANVKIMTRRGMQNVPRETIEIISVTKVEE